MLCSSCKKSDVGLFNMENRIIKNVYYEDVDDYVVFHFGDGGSAFISISKNTCDCGFIKINFDVKARENEIDKFYVRVDRADKGQIK